MRKGSKGIALGMLLCAMLAPRVACAQGLPLIRDAEIEALLNDYAQPILRAAGLGQGRVAVRIVNNDAFNAFVVDGRSVYIHTGALLQAKTPNEVIGVLAHEAGHIAGGHMAALRTRIARDQTRALIAQILGIGLMVAGGATGDKELGTAGQGVLQGGPDLIMRSLASERRSQESAADQAGLKYLTATGQSGNGMLETFMRFAQQEYLSDTHKDAFARTHPVATERLARLRQLVESSAFFGIKDTPELQFRHDMMRAKLSGYIERPGIVNNRYPVTDKSMPGRYARAIARFRQGGNGALDAAMLELDALIREQPGNPYFWEAKGDILQKSGRSNEAIGPLRKALQLLKGDAPLISVELAQSLIQSKDPKQLDEAIGLIRKSIQTDGENAMAYNMLGQAYYDKGLLPQSELARAQGLFYFGALKQAQDFAKRAQVGLKPGTPEWIKADDIINYKPPT